jgi:pre-mRNA-splicing factor SYF1
MPRADGRLQGRGGPLGQRGHGRALHAVVRVCEHLTFNRTQLAFEEELLRTPYSIKTWLRYAQHVQDQLPRVRYAVYERALKLMPGRFVAVQE